ncbi:hypothetical protein LWI28_017091 [Acer negundo]|uniref:Purple acid phosphatase n=1 Tax=Acer negundo TaxID=4023 RepID=A0AAD5IWF5_ACENE|nr:hypothetical protein LWI28_017091 [Acer negundo]
MTVTWTSGYDIGEATPFVEWGIFGDRKMVYIQDGSSLTEWFIYPGQDSLQRVIIFGDMGKAERDGSNEYSDYQPGSLNTTDQLVRDLNNIYIVFHIGDLTYSNGYLSQWDQFTSQVEPIASTVPYMIGRYSTDYGIFCFCIAESDHDWREGSEQYRFIEQCLASVDRRKQPWLIFAAHRVLGYSSDY